MDHNLRPLFYPTEPGPGPIRDFCLKENFHWFKKSSRIGLLSVQALEEENINWVARMLGHKSPVVTLKKYNRFVPNLTRTDGKALVEAGNFAKHFAQHENLIEEYQ
jgi:hypothetical protein